MKNYEKIEDMFADGLFQPSDIIILWGKRGKGKSSLAGKFMSEFMRPKIARKEVQKSMAVCDKLKSAGYVFEPPEDHTVFCDTYFERKTFRRQQSAYHFSALDFGLPNQIHKTGLLLPYGKYFFDEIQDLFDSHGAALATFISKSFELSRQVGLFICLCLQRPMRLAKDIRELATFVEVVDMKNAYNKYGRLIATTWTCYIIYDNARLEQYLTSKDESLVDKKVKITYIGNIFSCYDTNYFLPMYYRGFENTQVVYEKTKRVYFTEEDFKEYFKQRVIDIPDTYRGKKKDDRKRDAGQREASNS